MNDVHALSPGDGKIAPPAEHFGTVVVGAGPAGTTAAIAAAQAGGSVLLIDENPVPAALIGTDVPLFWGGRATAAVQNSGRMVEALFLANPALEAAFDAGVDVRLGTAAWGLYANGPAQHALPGPMLGLADGTRAWFVGFDALVLATGARDVVLGFPGWDAPGVMGAQAFHALLTRYGALATRRVVVVGSDALALDTALLAHAHGIEIAAIVEAGDAVRGPADLRARIAAAGLSVAVSTIVAAAESGLDGVERVILAGPDGDDVVAIDTICLAIAVEPATELLDAAGRIDVAVSLVGDAAGPSADPAYVALWAAAFARVAVPETIVCQCEGVTRADILGVAPPAYLDRPSALAARSLATLAGDGRIDPDQIKRLTRAGMGVCQGRRCRTQVACLLAAATGTAIAPATYRTPVRPIPLGLLAAWDETAAMAAGWDVWFGIPTQWVPYAAIGTAGEDAYLADGGNRHV